MEINELREEFFTPDLPEGMSTVVGFTSDLTIVKSNKVDFKKEWVEYTGFILKRFYDKDIDIILNGNLCNYDITPYRYEVQKTVTLANPGEKSINKELSMYFTFEFDNDLSVSECTGCVNMVSVYKGLHVDLVRWAITDVLREKYNITHRHLYEGLKVNVILLARKVGYDSQTKERLVSINGLTDDDWSAFNSELWNIYEENNEEIQAHVDALNELAATYEKLSARSYIEQMINISTSGNTSRAASFQPVKLIDAAAPENDRGACELFIAEGESAKGTIMKVRDPYKHAVMPLRGVSLNTSWKTIEEAFENDEIRDIISAIGTGVDDYYDLNALRYDKIIIATDADADGCFSGDTKISLCNGTEVPIKELCEKYPNGGFYVYSKDKDGNIVPGLVTKAAMTNNSAKVMKVTLDNGEEIVCTPSHPFQLKDLTYKRADELKVNDSLSSRIYNHRVASIEYLDAQIPVYNLEVKDYHNYALTAGVFVHNCHISALLLGVFASFMRFLVETGHVYVLCSPFYKQYGRFIYRDELELLDKTGHYERYKGLGSMHAYTSQGKREIEQVFIDEDTRHLIQVTPEDMDAAIMTLGDKYTRNYLMKSNSLVIGRDE